MENANSPFGAVALNLGPKCTGCFLSVKYNNTQYAQFKISIEPKKEKQVTCLPLYGFLSGTFIILISMQYERQKKSIKFT